MKSVVLTLGILVPSLFGVDIPESEGEVVPQPEITQMFVETILSSDEESTPVAPYVSQEKALEHKTEYYKQEIKSLESIIDEKEEAIEELESKNKDLSSKLVSQKEVSKEEDRTVSTSASSSSSSSPSNTFEATYYGMDCNGCSGTTASGLSLSSGQTTYNGMKVIAVDPSVIPLHSVVEINDGKSTYTAVAKDTGGNIKGSRIDILVGSEAESSSYGRHNVQLKVIKRGNGAYTRE